MSKARMYGSRTDYVPNDRADRRNRPKQFFRAKDRADDWERVEERHYKRLCQGKAPQREDV